MSDNPQNTCHSIHPCQSRCNHARSPVDVTKTHVVSASPVDHRGLFGLLKDQYRREGFTWVFRGWMPSFIRLGLHTIATFLILEKHKSIHRELKGIDSQGGAICDAGLY